MKRMLCGALAALLFAGCGANLAEYPWVEPSASPLPPPTVLTLTLPEDGDDILYGAVVLLEAKLKELSGERITLKTVYSQDPQGDYREGGPGLYLLTSGQIAALDDRMNYSQMPYLFQDVDRLFAHLNNGQGAIRSSPVTARRLEGEVVGVYYGGAAWMLNRAKFYDDVGFYSTVGVRSGMAGNNGFGAIGGEQLTEGTDQEIFEAFAQEAIKFCELWPGVELPPEVLEKTKTVEPTQHRFLGWWMTLKNPEGAYETQVVQMIREAFAYTLEQQNSQRRELENQQRQWLIEQYGIELGDPEGYEATRTRARQYYRENREVLGIPDDIWNEISSIIG